MVLADHRQRADLAVAHDARGGFDRRVGCGHQRVARHEVRRVDACAVCGYARASATLSAAFAANGLMSAGKACSTSECVTMPSSRGAFGDVALTHRQAPDALRAPW